MASASSLTVYVGLAGVVERLVAEVEGRLAS